MLQSSHLVNLERVAFRRDEVQIRVLAGGNQFAGAASPTRPRRGNTIESLRQKARQSGFANVVNAGQEVSVRRMLSFNRMQQKGHSPIMTQYRV
jgi:hypothetical protein